jgi:hypothetical protein
MVADPLGQALVRLYSKYLLDFLTVAITEIVFLAPVIEFQTSPTRGVRRNAGRASGEMLDRRLSVK